jgi:RND family efflux transporter MFP subunit
MIHRTLTSRVGAATTIALLAFGASACSNDTAAPATSARAPLVADTTPTTANGITETSNTETSNTASNDVTASTAMVSGTLEPLARAVLRAELGGALRTLPVKVGDRVTAGQVIATLDIPAVRSAMAAADAQLLSQETALRQATRERDRVAQLLAVGGVSRAEMDEWDSRVEAGAAAVQAAQSQRAAAAADVARLSVRAPFAGIVERRTSTQGSIVQPGDELVSIIDARTLELEAGIATAQAAHVRPGARVALRVAGFADSVLAARIERVAPSLDPVTRQLRVIVRVPNHQGRFPAGAWAEGTVLTSERAATSAAGGR